MKATAVAPSNIAFIKYWGKKDEKLNIPQNGSISMNLSNLLTTTTVEFSGDLKEDVVTINQKLLSYSSSERSESRSDVIPDPIGNLDSRFRGNDKPGSSRQPRTIKESSDIDRIVKHLDTVRSLARINHRAKVVTKNNFPTSTGLSSSASGFAALTLAASNAASLKLSEKELSILARQGSGSACRSIPDGFVEWIDGDNNETSYALSLFPPNYWDIVDIVAIVSTNKKEIPTTEGQKLARSSPFLSIRLKRIKDRISLIKKYLKGKNFKLFGELIEQEALEMHAIMLTSTPPLIYWLPATIRVMHAVQKWRNEGLKVYFTVNTGQNIHLICQKKDAKEVARKVSRLPEVSRVTKNIPSVGARIISTHLF